MAVFTVVFAAVVFLLAGLLVDGGAMINAQLRAAGVAEQAARAAADSVDEERLRATGRVRLRGRREACGRAREIVRDHGSADVALTRCEVGAGRTEVTVEVAARWDALFLAVLGFPGGSVHATATAGPDTGEGLP